MSGVNSKCSRGDLTPPGPKRRKQEDSTSTLAGTGSAAQMKTSTSQESLVDRVSNFPLELLADFLSNLAADCDLEILLNLRLVSKMLNREVYSALKTNPALLPWIVLNANTMDYVKTALSRNECGNYCVVKSLEGYRRNFDPEGGLPIKLVANRWTPELASFLHDYSNDIISFFMCGKDFDGFPVDLGGIDLPALEHAPFSAICGPNNKGGFIRAQAFWKKLVEASKILKTCQVDIDIPWIPSLNGSSLSPDDQAFDQVEWSQVNSLLCSYEFFARASASNELFGLRKLQCVSTLDHVAWNRVRHISLEKAANLTEMKFGEEITWILNHPMKNLKVLTLEDTTIICEQSPSIFLPNLEKISVGDSEFFTVRNMNSISGLVRRGGVYENVAELELSGMWATLNVPSALAVGNLAVQLCDCFPKLRKLEWESGGVNRQWNQHIPNNNAFIAAPVVFSKLHLLTILKLRVKYISRGLGEREVVELVTGIRLEEIPAEEDSWPTALTGNPRSITNLKHLQSLDLQVGIGNVNVYKRHTNFLFAAAFRTMATLNDLSFEGIIFKGTSCATEWRQLGRAIKITRNAYSYVDDDRPESSSESEDDDTSESSSESEDVDESSGVESTISDSNSESSGDE